MKKIILCAAITASIALLMSCGNTGKSNSGLDTSLVEDIMTVQAFKEDEVPESDIKKIVNAGVNAQSAMNGQPWHFSVVTNKEILNGVSEKMKANMPKPPEGKGGPDGEKKAPPIKMGPKAGMGDSPVAIIISAKDGSEYDAGLASELMTVEAVLLGYGTKIISSPSIVLNGPDKEEYKKILGIPENMSVKGVVLIGKSAEKKSDAVSGATPRKPTDEIVNFVK